MRGVAALAVALFAAPAFAEDYDQTCNGNGYVISADKGVFAGAPLYLGNSCDAYSARTGEGRWCWQNSGVSVEMGDTLWLLAHVELYCQAPGLDDLACSCIDYFNEKEN